MVMKSRRKVETIKLVRVARTLVARKEKTRPSTSRVCPPAPLACAGSCTRRQSSGRRTEPPRRRRLTSTAEKRLGQRIVQPPGGQQLLVWRRIFTSRRLTGLQPDARGPEASQVARTAAVRHRV